MTVAVRPQLAAIIVRETTRIRDAYSSFPTQNSSYGLTPIKTVALDGNEVRFRFTGKSGKQSSVRVRGAIMITCRASTPAEHSP